MSARAPAARARAAAGRGRATARDPAAAAPPLLVARCVRLLCATVRAAACLALRSTTVAFTVIRGTGDTRGLVGLAQPLAIVSLPTVAYAAYSRVRFRLLLRRSLRRGAAPRGCAAAA